MTYHLFYYLKTMKFNPKKTSVTIYFVLLLANHLFGQEIINGWKVYNTVNSRIPDNHICDVKVDEKDAVWVATWSGGLAKLHKLRWTIYTPATCDIPSYSINQVDIDKKGRVWVATNGGGIACLDGETWTSVNLPDDNIATAIAVSEKGDKLIGTPKHGLFLYNNSGELTKIWGFGVQNSNKIYHISYDKDGNALVSTAQGLLKFPKTGRTGFSTSFTIERPEHTLRCIMDTKERLLAVDYETGHLFIKSGNNWKEEKTPHNDIMVALNDDKFDYAVSAITMYKNGQIVAGTRYFGGIIFQPTRDRHWSPALPPYAGYDLNGGITCLAEGEKESVWVGTYYKGLMIPAEKRPEADTMQTDTAQIVVKETEEARELTQKRRIIVKDTIRFEGGDVDLLIWDAQKPDGDIISLIYNGKIILDKYEVKKRPYRLKLHIDGNQPNKLIMYAHNIGEIPPNTATLSIVLPNVEKEIKLTSDMSNAEAIIIINDLAKAINDSIK